VADCSFLGWKSIHSSREGPNTIRRLLFSRMLRPRVPTHAKTGRVSNGGVLRQKCASGKNRLSQNLTNKTKGLARNMNFDDTARFFGPSDNLWPDLFRPEDKRATKLCLNCHKRKLRTRQKYCPPCASNRKRESNRRHIRRKRGFDVGKLGNSPIGVEAVTKPETQGGYDYSQMSISRPSFPTGEARVVP
jgi:hypothetical protein